MGELKKIIILGEGVTAHAVAAFLSHALSGAGIHICLLGMKRSDGDDSRKKLCCVESLSPVTQVLHETLGINEADLLSATTGTFNLGYRFEEWFGSGGDFVQSYNAAAVNFGGIDFQNFYTKFKNELNLPAFDHFSLAAMAARKGRFSHPNNDQRSVLSTLDYGLNLSGAPYTEILKKCAARNSVEFISEEFVSAELDDAGFITSIVLRSGRVEGDFFIDCSGSDALLLGQTLGVKNIDWSGYFNANCTANFIQAHERNIPVVTNIKRFEKFWVKSVPLQHHGVNTVVFNNRVVSENVIQSLTDADITFSPLAPGYKQQSWCKNVVALGAAAGSFEPLPFSGMDVLYKNLNAFLPLFPRDSRLCSLNAEEYNRQSAKTYERLRDYHLSHHFLASFHSGIEVSSTSLPDELAHRINLFRARGSVPHYDDEMIPADMWASLFIGLGLLPQSYNPLADVFDAAELGEKIQRIGQIMQQTAEQLPTHADYLERYMQWKRNP